MGEGSIQVYSDGFIVYAIDRNLQEQNFSILLLGRNFFLAFG